MTRSHAARCGFLIYRENYGGRNAGRTGRNDQNRETGKRRPSGFKNGVIIGLVLGLLIRESVPESESVRMRILQTIMLYLDHRE